MESHGSGGNPGPYLGRAFVRFSESAIASAVRATGFRAEVLEKVLQLVHLLNAMTSHPGLKDKWALKGGTALNLFVRAYPRLSVDADLNYIGAVGRSAMLADRARIEGIAPAVFSREGFAVRRVPREHAGGKWVLSYVSFTGQSGNLGLDLNYMFRQPLWDVQTADSHPFAGFQARRIPLVDPHELVAGKLAALLSRREARDLFDCHDILDIPGLDRARLRLAFLVYGAGNRRDWRTVSVRDVDYDPADLAQRLVPTLRGDRRDRASPKFGEWLAEQARRTVSAVLPLRENERAFLDLLLEKGENDPSLLTPDAGLQDRIRAHPLLQWKALQVRRRLG